MKNKILENMSFAVLAITLVVIAIFNKNANVMLYVASIGMIIYGLLASILKNRYGAMILGGGISLILAVTMYNNKILDKVDSLTFFVALTMCFICIISYVFMIINEKTLKSKYNMEVEAEVIDLEKNPNTKKEYYRPIYAYYLDNGEYKVALPYYLNKNFPKIGDKIKLKLDSNDHADVYFEKTLLNKLYYWSVGIVMIIASIGIIISLFV